MCTTAPRAVHLCFSQATHTQLEQQLLDSGRVLAAQRQDADEARATLAEARCQIAELQRSCNDHASRTRELQDDLAHCQRHSTVLHGRLDMARTIAAQRHTVLGEVRCTVADPWLWHPHAHVTASLRSPHMLKHAWACHMAAVALPRPLQERPPSRTSCLTPHLLIIYILSAVTQVSKALVVAVRGAQAAKAGRAVLVRRLAAERNKTAHLGGRLEGRDARLADLEAASSEQARRILRLSGDTQLLEAALAEAQQTVAGLSEQLAAAEARQDALAAERQARGSPFILGSMCLLHPLAVYTTSPRTCISRGEFPTLTV